MDGRKLALGLEAGLLRRIERVRIFVGVLREMLQREFFPAPYVLRHWADNKLNLLTSAIEHVQALAYLAANCNRLTTTKRADQVQLSWSNRQAKPIDDSDQDDWHRAWLAMSNELSRLLRATHANASRYSRNVSTRVVPEVASQLRLIQENVDDIYRVLEVWSDLLDSKLAPSNVPEVRVRLLTLESTSRTLWSTFLDAERVVKHRRDLLNICIHTRMATAAGLYALALDFDKTEAITDVYARLQQLHEDAIEACHTIMQAEHASANPMFIQARESIEWRKDKLLRDQDVYLKGLQPEEDSSAIISVVSSISAGIDWTSSSGWFDLKLKGRVVELFRAKSALKSQLRNDEELTALKSTPILVAKLQLVNVSRRKISWSGKRKEISISERARDIDTHWLSALKSIAVRCLAGQANGDLVQALEEEIALRRLRAIRSLAISNVRIMSSKGLDTNNLDLVTELERYNRWIFCSEIENEPNRYILPRDSWRLFQADSIPSPDLLDSSHITPASRNLAVARLATCHFTTKKHKSLISLRSVAPLSLAWRARLPADYVELLMRHGLTRETLLAQLSQQFRQSAEPDEQPNVDRQRVPSATSGTPKRRLGVKPGTAKPHIAKFRTRTAAPKPSARRASGKKH